MSLVLSDLSRILLSFLLQFVEAFNSVKEWKLYLHIELYFMCFGLYFSFLHSELPLKSYDMNFRLTILVICILIFTINHTIINSGPFWMQILRLV